MDDQVFLARGYLERGNVQHSIKMLEEMHLVPENDEHLEALILLIESYNEADRDEEALELARELLRRHPDDNDVQDCVLHLFSSFHDTALEAEELALDLAKLYPERSYYPYMLAYLGHAWLPRDKEFILEHLDEALRLSGGTRYLKTAFDVYHTYDMKQERADCVAAMVEHSPDSYETRRCLILEKIHTRQFEEAAELGIELLMDYPQESWLTEKIDEVKDLLYGNSYEQFIQRVFWKVEKRIEDTNSQFVAYFYLFCFYVVLAVVAFAGLIIAPFFIVKYLVVDESLHIRRLETDSLYRKLTEVADIVQHIPGGIVFLLTEVTNSQQLVLLEGERCIIAKGLRCSFRELQSGADLEAFVKPKVYQRGEICKIAIRDTEFVLEFNEVTRLDKDFCFLSPEVPRQLRAYLKESGWDYDGEHVQSKADILHSCALFALLIWGLLYGEWPGDYGFELQLICSSVVLVNGIVYLWHRMRKPVVSEVYAPGGSVI